MKTENIRLYTDWIYTEGLDVAWYKSGQMRWHEELKNDKRHGSVKWWWRDGRLGWHELYENGGLVKRIV